MDQRFSEFSGDHMDQRFSEFSGDANRRFTESREDMHGGLAGLREDIREVRRDVNGLREAVGALRERTGATITT